MALSGGSGLFIGGIAIFGVDRAWKMPYFWLSFSAYRDNSHLQKSENVGTPPGS
jgi:hypothetical protein